MPPAATPIERAFALPRMSRHGPGTILKISPSNPPEP